MQRTDIRTVSVGLPDEELNEVQSLSEQAVRILGYTGYETALRGQILDRVIQELRIPVLDDNDVACYQTEKIQEIIRERHPRRLKYGKHKPTLLALIFLAVSSAVIAGLWQLPEFLIDRISFVVIGVIFGAMTTATTWYFLEWPQYAWQRRKISGYKGQIPEFAIEPALRIKQALPATNVYLEELAEIKDPFIRVEFGSKKRYIAAYAEPKFERNL